MISLSASDRSGSSSADKPGGFSVGGAFALGSRKDDKARRKAERAEAQVDHHYVDNSARTDLAVSVQHLSITYRTTFERVPTFKNAIVRAGRGERALVEVKALKDVSFEVPNGTALGIIGANGAGKSTIMRTIAGILPPTQGRVEVWGRASTLLALGVGFNAQLSGRENVILGGLASGLSRKEVAERAEEVAEWAELGDYIDAPMRTYSSGMFSRLAFSVAVHMKPDILMIDEALSAGDAAFREKANAKMDELRSSARAMFLVSHGLNSIKDMCNDCIWLHKGQVMMHDTPEA
ncbi:MAG: ABC transporter ATP-binding protein, partial [Mobilicoccus sp.]|nr:ABC transporter ATP-binding protein [Mobilicoccus sp.]